MQRSHARLGEFRVCVTVVIVKLYSKCACPSEWHDRAELARTEWPQERDGHSHIPHRKPTVSFFSNFWRGVGN